MKLEEKIGSAKKAISRSLMALTIASIPSVCDRCSYSGSGKALAESKTYQGQVQANPIQSKIYK